MSRRRLLRLSIFAALAGSVGLAAVPLASPAHAASVVTFTSVGAHQWTVPEGITSVTIQAVGGGGGGGRYSLGGAGCLVTSTVGVTPGQVLDIYVGGGGVGTTGTVSAGGGGATTVDITSPGRIVAGGGGGGGGYDNVDPNAFPNGGGDGCGSDGTGSPSGLGGSGGIGGFGGGGGFAANGGNGLAGAGG